MKSPAVPPWFRLELEVRDYEIDIQGIVNNANYFHYYEHARHAYIKARGLDFAAMHEAGFDPVVYRAEIDYREALRPGERFAVETRVHQEGRLKLVFEQRILNAGGRESSSARFVVAMTRGGRPLPIPPEMGEAICGGADAG